MMTMRNHMFLPSASSSLILGVCLMLAMSLSVVKEASAQSSPTAWERLQNQRTTNRFHPTARRAGGRPGRQETGGEEGTERGTPIHIFRKGKERQQGDISVEERKSGGRDREHEENILAQLHPSSSSIPQESLTSILYRRAAQLFAQGEEERKREEEEGRQQGEREALKGSSLR